MGPIRCRKHLLEAVCGMPADVACAYIRDICNQMPHANIEAIQWTGERRRGSESLVEG